MMAGRTKEVTWFSNCFQMIEKITAASNLIVSECNGTNKSVIQRY
jgi:hypothetical protein